MVLWGFGSGLHTLELAVVQLGVEAACGQQFVVVALLHDVAVLHHKDDVGLTDKLPRQSIRPLSRRIRSTTSSGARRSIYK